jgi:hypothetical protein
VTDEQGKPVGLEQGQAVVVTTAEGKYTVLVNYSGKMLRCEGAAGRDRVVVQAVATPAAGR